MLSIDDATPAHHVSFVLDALGRHASQTIGVDPNAVTTTYAYLGTSNTVSSMSVGASVTTTSLIDAIGNRLGQGTGAGFGGYLIADLHGNIAGAVSAGGSPALLSAYRSDAYGETCGSWIADSGSINVPWRFGGRLLESISGTTTDLYDFGARSYDSSLGAFTSFDSVAGSAGNPLTLNRYLYANANPATLVDPDGHAAWQNSCHYDAEDCAVIAKAKANARIAGPGHVCADNSHWCGNTPPAGPSCLATNSCGTAPELPRCSYERTSDCVPQVPVTQADPTKCKAWARYCTPEDPYFVGLDPHHSVWESQPTFTPDADGNGHVSWNEIKLDVSAKDSLINLTGTPTDFAHGEPDGVSVALPVGLTVTVGKGEAEAEYELPLDLGSIGGGAQAGMITVPHTNGISAPGVDTYVSYGRQFTFAVAGADPIKAQATVTHHSLFIPGPNWYRRTIVATAATAVIVVTIIFEPWALPAVAGGECRATGTC
jgi:RHS repeat-associated protein